MKPKGTKEQPSARTRRPVSARAAAGFVAHALDLGDVLEIAIERDESLTSREAAAFVRALDCIADPKLGSLAELLGCAKLMAAELPTAPGAQPKIKPPAGRLRLNIKSVQSTDEPPASAPPRREYKATQGRPTRQVFRRVLGDVETLVVNRAASVARERKDLARPRTAKVVACLLWLYGIADSPAFWPSGRPELTSAKFVDAMTRKIDKLLRQRSTQR